MRIREIPPSDRPREKLAAHGAACLTDAELLAIFLRTGVKGKSAITLASELLRKKDRYVRCPDHQRANLPKRRRG